ncbi:MAG: chlorite dismutase family protein [Chloroflexi bacterium]|nr:chlorite dismutase family protein [Chloroflexota bacterium]
MEGNAPTAGETLVQFLFLKVDSAWRRLDADERAEQKQEFLHALQQTETVVPTHTFSTLGVRADTDFMLWRTSSDLECLEDTLSSMLATRLGKYLEVSYSFFGLLRRSTYGQARTEQDHAEASQEKGRYFVLYPFTKTIEWYLMSREERGKMMGQHISVGRQYPDISQILLYSTGLGDQEFIVGYETDSLTEFQDLVVELRSTEARRYTLQDTPIFTCVNRSAARILDMLG